MKSSIVLSHTQAAILAEARQKQLASVVISPDLGRSITEVSISANGIAFPSGEQLDWETIERITAAENKCFVITAGGVDEIRLYSKYTDRVYSLYPTSGAPTMLISGIPMHRIKGTDPHQDTLQKIKAIAPIVGRVLDTATGLGYTAIEAARTADQVVTIELDPTAIEIARLNPWSEELFGNPKVEQLIGDSYEVVQGLESAAFARVIHDPPAFSLAGDLYSKAFYQELHRILSTRGKLFHYIGDPESKSGHASTKGMVRRLQEAGFSRVFPAPNAFGVVAMK